MIPPEARSSFQEIIIHEMFEMERMLDSTWGATTARMSTNGMARSGNAMSRLEQDAVNSLKARGAFILGQLLRCLTAYRVNLNAETIADAQALLRETVEAQAQVIQSLLFSGPVFRMPGVEKATQQLQGQFQQEGPRLVKRLSTELSIALAASAPPDAPSSRAPTLTFNGPVALVQTGDGSQATVHQHIDASVKHQIAEALQVLLVQLDQPENASIGNQPELRGLVVEAKTEAEKPEPNTLKLGSSLRTIAEVTKFVGALRPAYEVIKPLLSHLGIHLP